MRAVLVPVKLRLPLTKREKRRLKKYGPQKVMTCPIDPSFTDGFWTSVNRGTLDSYHLMKHLLPTLTVASFGLRNNMFPGADEMMPPTVAERKFQNIKLLVSTAVNMSRKTDRATGTIVLRISAQRLR